MKQNWIEDNIIILSKQTIDKMLESQYPSNLIGLYCFYYYTAKWQKTNMIKCTTNYVMKGLNWTKEKVINTKKELKKNGLIEDRQTKNKKGQITGWYIKVNYIWKKETIKNQKVELPEGGKSHRVENPDTNALSANSLNALSANKNSLVGATKESLDTISNVTINNRQYISKEIEKSKISPSYGNEDINYLIEKFQELTGLKELDGSQKQNRQYCWLCLKKFGEKEKVEQLIKLAVKSDFHRVNLTSFKYIYYHAVKIVNEFKEKVENPTYVKIK